MPDVDWMQLYSGQVWEFSNPYVDRINIEDIAHSLSLKCRFNGHCRQFYSVAQHSLLVAEMLPDNLRLHGLMHDAAEAYISDIVRGLKNRLMVNVESESGNIAPVPMMLYEKWIQDAIEFKFGMRVLDAEEADVLKGVDNTALSFEAGWLFEQVPGWDVEGLTEGIPPMLLTLSVLHMGEVEELFLDMFHDDMGKLSLKDTQ